MLFQWIRHSAQNIILNARLVNIIQLALSFCYPTMNSQCTAIAGAAERNNLAASRKDLRVARPVEDQREKYFLQLPYRWSLPPVAASSYLHWLLSQSIYIVRINKYCRDSRATKKESYTAIGFSATSSRTSIAFVFVFL